MAIFWKGVDIDTAANGDRKKLSINLLGRLEVCDQSGRKLAIVGKKPQALLAYLAVNIDQPQSRDKLATLLWGDCPDYKARQNLRQCVSRLRKTFCDGMDEALLSETNTVGLNRDLTDIDVQNFLQYSKECTPNALAKAAELYRDELVEGLFVAQSEFETWVSAERDRFNGFACEVLEKLAQFQESSGNVSDAIKTGKRHVFLDQFRESAHRTLMRLYTQTGNRAAALKQYHTCSASLTEGLGTKPGPKTSRLHDQIQATGVGLLGVDDSTADGGKFSLLERPSIAVLPFDNMSIDTAHDHFADGITDNIITALAKVSKIIVVARNSTFVYKGRAVDIKTVGQEQDVRYVLEGSIRKGGDRLRVTAQLIDTTTGHHRWAEQFDRPFVDLFSMQDDITREIVSALQVNLTEGEQAQLWSTGTQSIAAWEFVVRANDLYNRHVREDSHKAHQLLEKAVQLDPDYAAAWCAWGWVHWMDARYCWGMSVETSLILARSAASKAHEIDPDAAEPLAIFAGIALKRSDHEKAANLARQAVERGAGHSMVLAFSGMVLSHCGHPKEAIKVINRAMRLCPIYPNWYLITLGRAYSLSGDNEMALGLMREAWVKDQNGINPTMLAAILAERGQMKEAKNLAVEIMQKNPTFSISDWVTRQTFKYPEDLLGFVEGLKKLSLPQ